MQLTLLLFKTKNLLILYFHIRRRYIFIYIFIFNFISLRSVKIYFSYNYYIIGEDNRFNWIKSRYYNPRVLCKTAWYVNSEVYSYEYF